MPARTILFTGFPGFIGRRLVARLLEDDPSAEVICLVQPRFFPEATREIARLRDHPPLARARLSCVTGDIVDPHLGLGRDVSMLSGRVNEVWHLAAAYDLAVTSEIAQKVNVEGTRHVLDFCAKCAGFRRLVYFSTVYVAGKRTGLIRENELQEGQAFKNTYEATKFAAEVLVADAMRQGLPAIVIRPAIVVGDSHSGETDKFDGPYFAFRLISLLRRFPMRLPRLGPSDAEVNIVPVDYLVQATIALARDPRAEGMTFQIVDPTALEASELYSRICELVTGRPAADYALPPKLVEMLLGLPIVGRWIGVPSQALAYFNHRAKFDSSTTVQLLQGSGIAIPDLRQYLPRLYAFWVEHQTRRKLNHPSGIDTRQTQ